jgi:outer membrane immunogenic protein
MSSVAAPRQQRKRVAVTIFGTKVLGVGVVMNKRMIAGIAIATLIAAPAAAADMQVTAPAVVDSWSGFYAGAALGGRFTDSNWTTTCLSAGASGGIGCPLNLVAQNGSRFPLSNPSGFSSAALRPSAYLGYNWQIRNWVVGAEGDAGWGKARNESKGIPGAENLAVTGSPGLDSAAVSTTWDASVRARAGFLIGTNVLLYATGGASWVHMDVSAYCGSPRSTIGWCAGPAGPGSNLGTESMVSTTRIGWTAGGGAEAMLWSNWLLRIEYRYANYGTLGFTLFPGSGACGPGCDTITAEATLRTHTVLVGFAYKFGGPFVAQ